MKKILLLCGLIASINVAQAANDAFEAASRNVKETSNLSDLTEAQNAAQQMLRLAQTSSEKSRALLNLGLLAQKQGRDEQARQFWAQIIQLERVPDEYKASAYYLTGGSFLDEKNYVAAREALQFYLKVKGTSADERATARLAIATTYRNQNNFSEARSSLEQITSDKATSPSLRATAQQFIGASYFDEQKWPEAVAAFHAVAAIEGVPATLIATAQKRANDAYVQQGDAATATSETARMATQFLQKADELAQRDNKDAEAIREHLMAALVLTDPDSVIGLWTREKIAETYLLSGDYTQARAELEKLAALVTPADATDSMRRSYDIMRQKAQQNLASSYRLEGQTERARQEYQKVLQMPNLDPNIQRLVQKQLDELR